MISTPLTKYYSGVKIKNTAIVGVCGMYGRQQGGIKAFGGEI
jgi:hypothetical protein